MVAAYAWNDAYASLKRQGVAVEYMNPREKVLTWVDTQLLLRDGPGGDKERYDYLNASLEPRVGKFMVEEYGYGFANKRSFEIADKAQLETFGYSDPTNLISNSMLFAAFEPSLRDKANIMFEELKAGF